MFVVQGVTPKGEPYSLACGSEVASDALARGVTLGPPHVMALLLMNEGRTLLVTPTGPEVVLNLNDPDTVLGALYALTRVVDVTGKNIPQVIPVLSDGQVG